MRRRAPAGIGLRAELAERFRCRAAEWRWALPEDEMTARYMEQTAAALDAGEPVELSAWELPSDLPHGFTPDERVTVEPDGSVSPAPPLTPHRPPADQP